MNRSENLLGGSLPMALKSGLIYSLKRWGQVDQSIPTENAKTLTKTNYGLGKPNVAHSRMLSRIEFFTRYSFKKQ